MELLFIWMLSSLLSSSSLLSNLLLIVQTLLCDPVLSNWVMWVFLGAFHLDRAMLVWLLATMEMHITGRFMFFLHSIHNSSLSVLSCIVSSTDTKIKCDLSSGFRTTYNCESNSGYILICYFESIGSLWSIVNGNAESLRYVIWHCIAWWNECKTLVGCSYHIR